MNTEALFLFLILLLGLVLCSFLGGNCGKEAFTIDIPPIEIDLNNPSQGSSSSSQGSGYFGSSYDNYNHYSGSSSSVPSGTIYYGPNGATATVITNSDGTSSIQLNQTSGSATVMFNSTPLNVTSTSATPDTTASTTPGTFYGPSGMTATFITGNNGLIELQFTLPNGNSIIFTQTNPSSSSSSGSSSPPSNLTTTSTQYYGSTGYPIQSGDYSLAYTTPNTSTNQYYGPYGGNASSITGPQGNSAYYAQGPNGNAVAGTTSSPGSSGYGSTYYSTLPPGIPASQIPPGQEDLYILKSEIVPPVCPACPSCSSSFSTQKAKCPPCPACARCPEPSFECKKVPNYNSINEDYLPQPVISDFSQFGM